MLIEQILTKEEFKTKRKEHRNFVLVNYPESDRHFPRWEEMFMTEWPRVAGIIPGLQIYKTSIFDVGFQIQFCYETYKHIISFAKIPVETIRARISIILEDLRADVTTFNPQEWDCLAKSPNISTRSLLALNPATPPAYLRANVRDPNFEVRLCTLFNPGTPDDVVFELRADGNHLVKGAAELRANSHNIDYNRFRRTWHRIVRYPFDQRISGFEFRILCSNFVLAGENTVSSRS